MQFSQGLLWLTQCSRVQEVLHQRGNPGDEKLGVHHEKLTMTT